MQPIGPYQRIRRLGVCQIGSIWSAVDGGQQSLVVVVLDVGIAGESRWRDAFAATTHAIAHSEAGSPLWVGADFFAATPWVAYPKDLLPTAERTFAALGMTYQPDPAEPDDPPATPERTPTTPVPPRQTPRAEQTPPAEAVHTPRTEAVHTPPAEATHTPRTEAVHTPPAEATQTPPADRRPPAEQAPAPRAQQTTSTDDRPPAVEPTTPTPTTPTPTEQAPMPVWAVPSRPQDTRPRPAPATPEPEPEPEPEPAATSAPKQSRAGRWALPVIGLVLGLVAGGGLVLLLDPGTDPPKPQPTAGPSGLPAPAPASAPLSPGLEPPAQGEWPALWVRFAATDRILTLNELDGLPFPIKVPPSWQCTSVERAEGLSKYQCGAPAGSEAELGGELVVRDCPAPCDGPRQTAMRTAEEAWGLQWVRSGPSSAYAETSSLTVDGEQRYGLVVVAYWRSDSGDIDKQLVLRMTAPVGGANQLRRVANYLRDVLIF
ncbi:hypothetical protein ACGFIW_10655 [Micromonospora sp. NPDC048935]|uniref:hypothetical protein n=1 Tax=Micromonospora sp. NPDC048935 TaxID=3364262 RepID=UPI003721595A